MPSPLLPLIVPPLSDRLMRRLNANLVVEKVGIGCFEVSPGTYVHPLSRIALEDVITAEHLRATGDD